MSTITMGGTAKITREHLERLAVVYVRQSTLAQVRDHGESTLRQYALTEDAERLGWPAERVLVIDADLGASGRGGSARAGFKELVGRVCCGEVARETLAHPLLPRTFKRAAGAGGPDEQTELPVLWHRTRRSILTSRQHLLNEAEFLLAELPLELREQLPDSKAVRPRLAVLARHAHRPAWDAPTMLRLRMLDDYRQRVAQLDADERAVCRELAELVRASGSTLDQLCGLSTRSVAELLAEVGDPRRFTEGGFARFNGSAPLPASTAEGPGEPVRHRYNPGGNRRVNAILHRMAVTQLRCEPRAQALFAQARARGHTKKEARRILKRHLSDIIHRRMTRDLAPQPS